MRNRNSFLLYLKKINYQIFAKLILVIFGFFIVYTGSLALSKTIYYIVILLYVSTNAIFLMRQKYRKKSHIVDMCFVLLLLFGSHLDEYLNFAFLLYPLVSRGAYIDRFTYDKYFICEYIALIIILNLSTEIHDMTYYIRQFVLIGVYALLNKTYVQRMKYDEKRTQMLDIADNYFIAQNKSYEVYNKIMDYLNRQKVNVTSITCIESDMQMRNFHLVNSSCLVSKWNLKLKNHDIRNLQMGLIAHNVNFVLNEIKQIQNDMYCIAQTISNSPQIYYFILTYRDDDIHFKTIDLEPLFLRMSRLISFERFIRQKRDVTIQDLLQKSRFVNGATNVMHFLKNRLTPLQTLVDLAKNEGDVKQIENYDELLIDTANRAQKEIDSILGKAEFMLNKQNNPFVFTKEDCDSHNIFVVLKSIWTNQLSNSAVFTVEMENKENAIYESNIEGLEILFSDIIGNIKKYSKSIQRCIFKLDIDSVLTIEFENDFFNKRDIQLIINDINNPNKDAVLYRTSYGIANIRAITDNLSIERHATIVADDDNELYHLELLFKPKKNEENINN